MMKVRERRFDDLSPQYAFSTRIRKIVLASFRILITQGPWSLVKQTVDKISRKEFQVVELSPLEALPTRERIRWRYAATNNPHRTELDMFHEFYHAMLSVARAGGEGKQETHRESHLPAEPPVKLIAFYLPQFHPIAENDAWWGTGFTEWTNVSKAVPQFVGHYQPRLPGELGFYDLRVSQVQEAQVALARRYGIYGFCFYYYWFDGRRLLEHPIDQFLSNHELDFPFCLCWANENWTRRWDGSAKDVLIGQTYSSGWDLRFIQSVENALRDRRYIRIGGRPLIIVYNAKKLPSPRSVIKRWREYCRHEGIGDLYVAAAQTFRLTDSKPLGFDAAIQFPPHNPHDLVIPEINDEVELLNSEFSGKIYDYRDLVEVQIGDRNAYSFERFLTVMPAWDNEPRIPGRGHIFHHATPLSYGKWLEHACRRTMRKTDAEKRVVFINAWNEWAEGAYLEPDRKYGRAYLQETRAVLTSLAETNGRSQGAAGSGLDDGFDRRVEKRAKTAVICHLFYPELVEEALEYLENLNHDFDLFISIPKRAHISEQEIRRRYPLAYFYHCENRGRDVAPFLDIFRSLYWLDYEFVCKIHTKKSMHLVNGELWRRDLYSKLLGSPETIREIKTVLRRPAAFVGIVAPAGNVLASHYYWGVVADAKRNRANVKRLCHQVGLEAYRPHFRFVAGSMFWFKPSALFLVTRLKLNPNDFEQERGQKDGTLAHAVERFFGLACEETGLGIAEADEGGYVKYSSLGATFSRWASPTLEGKAVRPELSGA